MSFRPSLPSSQREIFALLLLLSGVFFRVFRADIAPEVLPNFSPLMASALSGALFLPGLLGLVVPIGALLVSDALLNFHFGTSVVSMQLLWTLPCYLLAVGTGWILRNRTGGGSLPAVLGATLGLSVGFYIVTNTGCWLGTSSYPQTFAGWWQALTTGLPGYPPTWQFFRNSLTGDLLFAALFVALERSLSSAPKTACSAA